jgi:hypothetical protein
MGRKALTAEELRARGSPHWARRAEEERAKAKGEEREGELWLGVSGTLRSVIGNRRNLLKLARDAHVAYAHLRLFTQGMPCGLNIDEFDKLCAYFGLGLAVSADSDDDDEAEGADEDADEVSRSLDVREPSDIIETTETTEPAETDSERSPNDGDAIVE